jgi:hypothetical protein
MLHTSYVFGLTSSLVIFLVTFILPETTKGQGLELSGSWAHITGDFGTDGFNVGAAWWFTKRVTIAVDYENSWDTTSLSTFAFTQTGPFAVKSHLQSVVIGPRVFFSSKWTDKHKVNPFAEAQFGSAHLSQDLTQTTGTTSASDTAFAWLLGGGAEYLFTPKWSGRANLDFMRTHLSNEGQSRLRLLVGITYTFGSREKKLAAPEPTSHQPVSVVATSPARVHITSSPTGGEIYIDGKFYGNTPSDIILNVGDHSMMVVANGKQWSRTLHVSAGDIHVEADLSQP